MAPLHALDRCSGTGRPVFSGRPVREAKARLRLVAVLAALVAGGIGELQAQAHRIATAPAGLLEAGVPLYSIRDQEALGLSQPPTDIEQLPDGRVLVFGGQEFAIGDGARWEVYRQAPDDAPATSAGVVVDRDGSIYMGVPAGFARVEFGEDGQWRLRVVTPWAPDQRTAMPLMRFSLEAAGQWFWHAGTGALMSWRPGEEPRFRGRADTVHQVVHLRDSFYLSDHTNGTLWRLGDGAMEPVAFATAVSVDDTFTCGLPWSDGELLVGTYGHGLQVFDGQHTRPFCAGGVLTGAIRVNDVCAVEGGFFAVAVEHVGIVFIDGSGHLVQVLDRALDHRLSHVRRLLPAPGGILWARLNEGVLRVEFPARVSHFEPLLESSLAVAHPERLDGRLWVMADGKVHRGVYDGAGRLLRFDLDTPAERFVYAFSCALGRPIVGTHRGAYQRTADGWSLFLSLSANLRVLDREPIDGRWLYGAVGEIGWLRPTGDTIAVERIPVDGLGNIYNAVRSRDGTIWFELGHSRVGRVRMTAGPPQVDLFEPRDGLPDGWVNLFTLGDDVGFNVEGQILRFDEAAYHFVPDAEFARQFPGLAGIVGRPVRDAQGRVWITANGRVQVLAARDGAWRNLGERMPSGLQPNFFTVEDDGVVWMHAEHRLARFDPALPVVPPVPLQTLITHVTLPASGRTLFQWADGLPPLDYEDNSLMVHFVASGIPFTVPVRFDVKLDGGGTGTWIPAGGGGSAVFSRLKGGDYVLHVRPHAAGVAGAEQTLAFSVRPPWYRETIAYVGYAVGAVLLVLLVYLVSAQIHGRAKRTAT